MMKRIPRAFISVVLFLFSSGAYSQSLSQYRPAKVQRTFVPGLKDTMELELLLPREMEMSAKRKYPVIYIFDRQNAVNYRYILQTIDYLTGLGNMPPAMLVGVRFPSAKRTIWTIPAMDSGKGKADSLMNFLLGAYRKKLASQYPLANFNLLLGHSRTAMLASWALATYPDQVNAVIAASNSFFDFNTTSQQQLFEQYIARKETVPGRPQFFFFSSGTEAQGDAHEASVVRLETYMQQKKFPSSFYWKCYREPASHISTPGLTHARALNELFSPTVLALQQSFALLNKQEQTDSIPWSAFRQLYNAAGRQLDLPLGPDITFYNSLANGYINDYNEQFKERKLVLSAWVLERGIQDFPGYPGFYSFLAAIKTEQGNEPSARQLLQKGRQVLKSLKFVSESFRAEELAAIEEAEADLKSK